MGLNSLAEIPNKLQINEVNVKTPERLGGAHLEQKRRGAENDDDDGITGAPPFQKA